MNAEPIAIYTLDAFGLPRSRTITWYAPGPVTAKGLSMRGIDHLTARMNRDLPPAPISALFQMEFTAVEPVCVTVSCVPDESAYNATGTIHGGFVCTLLDTVVGCALYSTLPEGKGMTSIEIKITTSR